jgi:hypothetical protein
MAEAVVCIAIVGVLLVAAMSTVAFGRTAEHHVAVRDRGLLLARELLAEMTTQPYADPEAGSSSFGRESAETGTGTRALFDDVDDYHTWEASPPQAHDGTVMADLTGWKRAASVFRLDSADLGAKSATETGLKLCVVTVSYRGAEVARLTALRSEYWVREDSGCYVP